MSLNWDISKVENYKELTENGLNSVTNALIWGTMAIGMREITSKNWERFYKRLHILERVKGAFLVSGGNPVYLTKDDVKRHIGLTTNVSNETDTQFYKGLERGI